MFRATAKIKGASPLAWTRYHGTPKLDNESDHEWEERTWRERFHFVGEECAIPPMALKRCIEAAARHSGKKIKGAGNNTYTKHFESGVMAAPEPARLGVMKEELLPWRVFVPSDGKKGGSKRVHKCFPMIPEGWEAEIEYVVMDDKVTQKIFEEFLRYAGRLIGIGNFRPANGGYFGRFEVESIEFEKM